MSLKLEHVNYIYSPGTAYEIHALKDICLELKSGEFVGLIGHTGSGKSTLVQHLNGLVKATEGRILFHGEDIYGVGYDMRRLRSKVGLVFQYPEHQLFEMTVYKDVAFGPSNMKLSEQEIDKRVREALQTVGLSENVYEKSPFELSGGQKRRVAIAGVLAMNPEVLILDEPTAGLDPKGRDEILYAIKKLHEKRGITIILVSHSMEDVAKLADRLIVMEKGRVAMTGTPKEVFARVEELEKIGLAAPQISYVLAELKQKGYNLPNDIYTVEEAVKALYTLLKGEEKS